MPRRGTTISVSHTEKRLLDTVAKEEFGTASIPYGEIVGRLACDRLDNDGTEGDGDYE